MLPPILTTGPTLARRYTNEQARLHIEDAIDANRVRGSVCVAVSGTSNPARHDVDALIRGLDVRHALDALRIAHVRLAALHGVEQSDVPVIDAEQEASLRVTAELLVDRFRAFGWWQRTAQRVQRFFGSAARFRHDRETCIRELMRELAVRTIPAEMKEAAE